METSRSADGPFSPGWENQPAAAEKTPHKSARKEEANTAKKTPKIADNTPKGRHTSPKSEFGYDDAYSVGGDEFTEQAAVRKSRTVTRRRSPKAKRFQKAKQTFLAPTSCSTVKQRTKATDAAKALIVPDTASKHEMKQPTVPISPHFRTRAAAKNKEQPLTTDDLLFQKLEKERAEEAERVAKAKKLYSMLKTRASRRSSKLFGKVIPESATKAAKPVAVGVKQFNKPRKVPAAKVPAATPSTVKKGPGGVTLVEPFQFATDKRIPAVAETPDPVRVQTSAEMAQNFMRDSRSHGAPTTAAQRLTVGQSPKLRTQKRGQFAAKKPKPPTAEEKVAAEMEEINKHPFRARRLDRRIFESAGELGVPKVAARPVTEPVEFEFRADKRSAQPRVRASASLSPTKRSTTSFKAKPAPKTASKMPAPKSKTVFKPTIAMSPKFNGGARASIAPARRQRAPFNPAATIESQSAPSEPLKVTEPKEFKFASDNRGEYRRQQLEKQVAAEAQALAAAREVKAHPMPDYSKMAFQPDLQTHKAPATETKPFQLRSALRHADAVSAFQQEALALTEQEKVEFHARPVPQTTYKPDKEFVEPTDHAPIVPLPITLESERRALKRQEFDQVMVQKMAQLEVMQETIAKQKLDQENRRIQSMRRKSVEEGGLMFKAKPIVTKDQYPTKAVVSAPLTTPFSPQLRTKTRSSATSAAVSMSSSGLLDTKKQISGGAKRITSSYTGKEEQQRAEIAHALSAM